MIWYSYVFLVSLCSFLTFLDYVHGCGLEQITGVNIRGIYQPSMRLPGSSDIISHHFSAKALRILRALASFNSTNGNPMEPMWTCMDLPSSTAGKTWQLHAPFGRYLSKFRKCLELNFCTTFRNGPKGEPMIEAERSS